MKKISDFNSATEKYPVVYAGSATRPEYVDMPTILQQQEGVAPMDTLPAQWWNAMWKLATKDINAFRDFVGDAFTEINNLLTEFGITLDDADSDQLYDFFHDTYVQNYVSKTLNIIYGDLHIKGDLSVDGIGEEIISTELKVGANTITLRNDNPTALGNTELAGIVTKNYDGNNNNNIIAIKNNGEARTGDIDIATRILYSNDETNFYTDEDLTTPATIGANEEVRDTGNQTSGGVEIYEGITYSNDDTQPLLTRDESNTFTDGHILVWDATNKRAIDGGALIAPVLQAVYPVGCLYWTSSSENPATTFGFGTWLQIKDKFILAAGDTYSNGASGGAATVTLTTDNMPSHTHTGTTNGNVTGITAAHDHIHSNPTEAAMGTGAAMVEYAYPTFAIGANGVGWKSDVQISVQCTGPRNPQDVDVSNPQVNVTDPGHTHSFTTGSSGSGTAHNNMPPYIVKYCWERTA
jgi:microcystin-dependent protein